MSEHDCGSEAAAYALGALEPDEAHAFEAHIESCAVCRDEVAAFVAAADALPLAAPQHPVPPALRRRVMREVAQQSRRSAARPSAGWLASLTGAPRRAAAGLAVAVAVGALVLGISLAGGGSATRVIKAGVGSAELQISGSRGQLVVAHLPRPGAGRIYELWIQRGSSAPSPSTLFSVAANGRADIGVPESLHGVSRQPARPAVW